ncbi:MAG TPA: MFS transporter [Anaerolineales bacterium]|nr:MFS transporter [Anaerolineales bacterium]
MNLFRALHYRPFALLWTGQTISRVGDGLYRIALAWWVLEKTGSATAMGTVLIFTSVPMLLFLLVGGVVVDRLPRARVMLVSDFALGIIVAVVSVLAYTNLLEIWHIYVAGIVFGLAEAFFRPAYTAIVPDVTPREALTSANSLTALSQEVAGIGGPAIGAAIVAAGGTSLAFALDAVSFLISVGCLIGISALIPADDGPRESTSVVRDVREGIGVVRASPWLWITITMAAFANITLAGPFSVTTPFLIKEHLHADVGSLGLVYSVFSFGSVAAAVWLGSRLHVRKRGLLTYSVWLLSSMALAVIGVMPSVLGVAIAAFICGVGLSIGNLIWINTLQEMVPPKLLGRVSSIDSLGSFVFTPIGYGVSGWATDLIGPASVFILGGILTGIFNILGMLHPAVRDLD